MKIAFCSSEVVPFAKTGGLADVSGALPLALEKLGLDVSIFLPFYKGVDQKGYKVKKLKKGLWSTILGKNLTVYFIDHKGHFHRDYLYGDGYGDYEDNFERFHFFCEDVLIQLKALKLQVDIVHCHDWQTALIPLYLKELYKEDPFFENTKTVFTIHNLAYQGVFKKSFFPQLGLSPELFSPEGLEFYDKINLLKGAILYSDEVTTVSPQYAKEILTKKYGCGLEGVLKHSKDRVVGILNGLDHDIWNPQVDKWLEQTYTRESYTEGKRLNKLALQRSFKLPQKKDMPVFGFVGRLSHQKGVDLILESLTEIMAFDVQLVFQGVGEAKIARKLEKAVKKYPKRIGLCLKFDERIAHLIYSGSDFFLMPSIYEPCGLSQLISMKYGTLPIAYKTGGLIDTISPYRQNNNKATGFIFDTFDKKNFMREIKRAFTTYEQPLKLRSLVYSALNADFSWESSAQEYKDMYQDLLIESQTAESPRRI